MSDEFSLRLSLFVFFICQEKKKEIYNWIIYQTTQRSKNAANGKRFSLNLLVSTTQQSTAGRFFSISNSSSMMIVASFFTSIRSIIFVGWPFSLLWPPTTNNDVPKSQNKTNFHLWPHWESMQPVCFSFRVKRVLKVKISLVIPDETPLFFFSWSFKLIIDETFAFSTFHPWKKKHLFSAPTEWRACWKRSERKRQLQLCFSSSFTELKITTICMRMTQLNR